MKNSIESPFVPNFAPKKLDSIDEGTKSLFKKHLEKIKGKKREVKIIIKYMAAIHSKNFIFLHISTYTLIICNIT